MNALHETGCHQWSTSNKRSHSLPPRYSLEADDQPTSARVQRVQQAGLLSCDTDTGKPWLPMLGSCGYNVFNKKCG